MNPHDVLRYGHRTFGRAIAALEPADWTRIVAGVWTPKDVVGHVSAIHWLGVSALAELAGEEAPPAAHELADDVDFNMGQAAIRASWPVEHITDEYESVTGELSRLAMAIDTDTWRRIGTIPRYGPEYSLEDYIVYRVYGHIREHATHLGMAIDLRNGAVGGS
ncbi:MAG: hypothetical protein L0221_01225 [Chloroflexi bacterium]|nr:hypothetical protein [Chloroflexota bacterium]